VSISSIALTFYVYRLINNKGSKVQGSEVNG